MVRKSSQSRGAAASRAGRSLPRLRPLALAVLGALAAGHGYAQPQAFGSMVAMQNGMIQLPNGTMSKWTGADRPVIGTDADGRPLMSIRQTEQKALLDWERFELQANEVLEFQQQRADWIAVNRVHSDSASRIDGEIRATGRVFILNDNGVLMGDGAKVNTRQLVTGKGVSDVLVDGATTTLVQSRDKATLNWSDMSLQAGEALKFQQEKKEWVALNRSLTSGVTRLDGNINADGHILLVAPGGLAINGKVDAQQVIASSLNIIDQKFDDPRGLMSWSESNDRYAPTFSNSWLYPGMQGSSANPFLSMMDAPPEVHDANDPLRYGVTVGRDATISTASYGKVMLFGPHVTNKGTINVQDEGQVVLAAGDNIYLAATGNRDVEVYAGAYNPLSIGRANISYSSAPWQSGPVTAEWVDFLEAVSGVRYEVGTVLTQDERNALIGAFRGARGTLIEQYLEKIQQRRVADVGFHARNEGIINATRGGRVDFRGNSLEQMGAITMTSTAAFRGSMSFTSLMQDYREYSNGDDTGHGVGSNGPWIPGNGDVIFGRGSLTQITPDLDSQDRLPVSEGPQSVGTLTINGGRVHLQEDALIYLPSGTIKVLLDAGVHVYSNRGPGSNTDNEDGTRFLMDRGATIDLSGWETTLGMGYHQVTGKLFAAQLKDSPLQRDGALYRQEISVDRRYGTNIADWASFDNLSQGTLAQFLINGGTFTMDVGDDFIMKPGSVIDVSGGKITYQDGYVYTTLLRRLDGSVVDIREANPDELYMGLANQWVKYDTKWGRQQSYYIPLMSSVQGKFETSYEHGGNAGTIDILAPDVVLQGTLKGAATIGRYQRANMPKGGVFKLNNAGESESEYVSNNVLIAALEQVLDDAFGLDDKLSDFFGEEFDRDEDRPGGNGRRMDNATLASADFFNRSSMGSYSIQQGGRVDESVADFPPLPGYAVVVEEGARLNLAHGGSLALTADQRMLFEGSVRTEGGSISLLGEGLVFGDHVVLDTRGSWYSDYELEEPVALAHAPRINGGSISLASALPLYDEPVEDIRLVLPDSMVIDTSGGAWVDRNGKITNGKGGDIRVNADMAPGDELDLAALDHARAYGLGGNGRFSLVTNYGIAIGGAAAQAAAADAESADSTLWFRPEFFSDSGFSAISFDGRGGITLAEGAQVHATSASLQLKENSLLNGVLPAFYAKSGTDIYEVAEARYLSPERRAAGQRDGMAIALNGSSITIGEDSLLATEAGGSLSLSGSIDIFGTLLAPAGTINVALGNIEAGHVVLHETARLLAPGAVRVLSRSVSNGRELVDGEVLAGGDITLDAPALTIEQGALLDVSGASAVFDLPQATETGAVVRQPRTVASDGGRISVSGVALDINDGTYLAHAGGAGARGGDFALSWGAGYSLPRDEWAPTPQTIYDYFSFYFEAGYFTDLDGNPIYSFFGTDLSRIDWEAASQMFGMEMDYQFAPGLTIADREALTAMLVAYDAAALGDAPVLMVGSSFEAPAGGSGPAPEFNFDAGLKAMLESLGGYQFPPVRGGPSPVTRLSADNIAAGGFSGLSLSASPGILFVGDVTLGGRRADGDYVFDRIDINAPRIMGQEGANVRVEAGIVNLSGSADTGVDLALYDMALADMGVVPVSADTRIGIDAGNLLQVNSASFYGFSDTLLASQGDIRLVGAPIAAGQDARIIGSIDTAGALTFKADQLYASTASDFTVTAGDTLTILPPETGTPVNASPFEAGATLTLKAPRIRQGGIVRSPLGTINLVGVDDGSDGANTVSLLPGSLTSVSAAGNMIPFGFTSNGDTWIDPVTGTELTALPDKAVNLTAGTLDMQEGAVLDVQGGGDLYASEFTPGIGGSTDWLTGYRDSDYEWVADASEIFAVIPGYGADIAPIGIASGAAPAIGEKIWLSGGSGLPAGYYTLLPARYALLPGAYRVTARHHYGSYKNLTANDRRDLLDGSSIQAGYRYIPGADGQPKYAPPGTEGYLVMPGATLRTRSQFSETSANGFYLSDAFLKKALRANRPLGEVPRIPLDGGSVVLDASDSINLFATLKSAAAPGGRGGFADIKGEKILVAGAGTDLGQYHDYLVLDSDRLNSFGAESLLLGGVRTQGEVNLEIDVGAADIVIDNAGSVLYGPELLFASTGDITVKGGSTVETRGVISGSSGDLRVRPATPSAIDTKGNDWSGDDEVIHEAFDRGTLLRLSSSEQVDILRNIAAIDAYAALLADPARLAQINDRRAAIGLAPIVAGGGNLVIADGAQLTSSQSLALDATTDTRLASGASLSAKQISAAASRVSVGAVPAGTAGLVFADGSLGALAAAQDILLRSYGSIDFHGPARLRADGALTLDSRQLRTLNADGQTVTIAGKALTLTNTNGGTGTAAAGGAQLLLEGDNIYLEGQGKWLSGMDDVTIKARERVIGRDMGTLYVPAALNVEAADLTAASGAQLFFDAQGAVRLTNNGNTALPAFETLGATLGITGANVINQGRIGLTGGTVDLRARQGNVTLADGSSIDVTSNTSRLFDIEVGVGGGTVNLTADNGDIEMAASALIDVSGSAAGGDAGTLNVSAGLGSIALNGLVKGDAGAGSRSGSFSLLSRSMADFAGLNAQLDAGGFRQSRRFEINEGDIDVAGTVQVQDFAVVANDGSITVSGTVRTVGDNGGRIQLAAAENVTLASGGQLLAKANAADGSGGTVFLETVGSNGGRIDVGAGSAIDVSGTGEGGRVVRLRAPQLGSDLAIDPVAGTITGARSVIAEGFRVYENVDTIDQDVIDTVSSDAAAFMANAAAIGARLGSGVTVAPGIELRSNGDMELVDDWDLHALRFGPEQSAGVLTLRAKGDLLINANLSDGFDGAGADAALLGGSAWTFNLTAGANTVSPDSLAVLPMGQLVDGKGSIFVGGTPDTTEYYRISIETGPLAGTTEHRLYRKNADGSFARNNVSNPHQGFIELSRDTVTGLYIDPITGGLIQQDPATGDYVDTATYGRRPLPAYWTDSGYGGPPGQFLNQEEYDAVQYGQHRATQWDNSTGYLVRTSTAGINIASGRDIVLQYAPSVIYTAGAPAAEVDHFQAPTRLPLLAWEQIWGPMTGYYPEGGGDILLRAQGDIVGGGSDQLANAWLWRYGRVDPITGDFYSGGTKHLGRDYEQTTWFVRFDRYQAGVGALGGGNVEITAGGDINNLTVNLPNTGRVAGGYDGIERVLHTTGGGDLSVRAGGNIGTGNFYVADGEAQLTAGGSFTSSRTVGASREVMYQGYQIRDYDLYTMLFTSSGQFKLRSGGDLNLDIVADPLAMMQAPNNMWGSGGRFGPDNVREYIGDSRDGEAFSVNFFSYTPQASVDLFSAGGDVKVWNNYGNVELLGWGGSFMQPLHYFIGNNSGSGLGASLGNDIPAVWPAAVSATAAAGSVEVKGGMYLAPSPAGSLQLLARGDVLFGYGTRLDDPYAYLNQGALNYFPGYGNLFMSQTRLELMPSATNIRQAYGGGSAPANILETAGYTPGMANGVGQGWNEDYLPDLHAGDATPVRIYAAEGDVVTTAAINVPKAMWVQAGGHVYFPSYTVQHNDPNDLSLVRAGDGLYFAGTSYISVYGPGRLEVETGRDFWIPSNAAGITSSRISFTDPNPYDAVSGELWHPEQNAADIAISTGYNQRPDYEAFENAYFNPALAGEIADYLLAEAGDGRALPAYLFDRYYARGNGAQWELVSPELAAGFINYIRGLQGLPALATAADQTDYLGQAWDYWLALPPAFQRQTAFDGLVPRMSAAQAKSKGARPEFYLPERREGLVNYVRRLQGLEPLATQAEQLAYLDTAWAYWNTLGTDYKTPMIRNAFFMELRSTGREANDVDSPRNNTTFRGYEAIGTLFPGAEKRDGETLAEGESRWAGDFETYASRVISNGGGKVEFVVPGGAFKLANVAATPAETGQPWGDPNDPWAGNPRGDALRAGVVTQDGGEINIFSKGSVTVNESRILTTKGGNVLIWSSYGDIAAGKGAKTSISPQFYDYSLTPMAHMNRVPAGLPTGAGIGTLATQPGAAAADVDLIAPNGIVDAGDAGLRVSGNFNVFAVQILGTDNIDVAGTVTGLPTPPAAPPTSLNVDDAAAKGSRVIGALDDSLKKVKDNATVRGPSIIEVKVLGYGEECLSDRGECRTDDNPRRVD